jgi:endonuclease/exonuclease/phosphatase (EEP) superfamily protein YafD
MTSSRSTGSSSVSGRGGVQLCLPVLAAVCVVALGCLSLFGGRIAAIRGFTGLVYLTALPWVGISLCLAGAGLAGATWVVLYRRGRGGPWRSVCALSALGLVLPAVLAAVPVPGTGPGAVGRLDQGKAGFSGSLRIVQANVLIDNSAWTDAVFSRLPEADAVFLAEASAETVRGELARRGLAEDYRVFVTAPEMGADTVLVIRSDLSPRPVHESLPYAAVGATVTLQESPLRLIGVHTASPMARSPYQRAWENTVSTAAEQCRADSLVAGDFNAVWRQLGPRTMCHDAAGTLGAGGPGSWPSFAPRFLGARIDHQIYDPARLCPRAGELFDIPGSDHRGTDFDYAVSRRVGGTQEVATCTGRN